MKKAPSCEGAQNHIAVTGNLLDFDGSAGFGEFLLGSFGVFLGHGFLQGGGSAVQEPPFYG